MQNITYQKPDEEPSLPLENPEKWVALTWDDGPSENTIALMNTLKHHSIPATFFVSGERIGRHSEAFQRMIDDGHEIGNHSWDHPHLIELDISGVRKQLTDTSDAIKKYTGSEPTLFRPGYIEFNDTVIAAAAERGMALINLDISTHDWEDWVTTGQIIQQLTAPGAVQNGSIIMCHDHDRTYNRDYDNTHRAIAPAARALRAQGFEFTTVSDLARRRNRAIEPGQVYWHFH